MPRRLLSFLGVGREEPPHYDSCRYALDELQTEPTRFVQRAISDAGKARGRPFDEIVLLCTEKARERWCAEGVVETEIGPHVRIVPIPDGKDNREMWEIFEAVRTELGGSAPGRDLDIHLDITHGFRVQPLLAMSALDFVRSEWLRQRIEGAPSVRVTYGAFAASVAGVAPVWDLTELLTVGRWNSALTAVQLYGRGDELAALTGLLGDEAVRLAREQERPKRELGLARNVAGEALGKAVKAFSDDLCTGRLKPLFGQSAGKLVEAIESEDTRALTARMPALRGTLDWLRDRVSGLRSDSVVSSEQGARATVAYARLCGELQRFPEQAAALREALVTLFALRRPWGVPLLEVGTPGMDDQRRWIEESWNRLGGEASKAKGTASGVLVAEAGGALDVVREGPRVGGLRNDVEHLGIRSSVTPAATVRENLKVFHLAVEALLNEVPVARATELPRADARGTFLNLSNHPVSAWPVGQRVGALALGLGEPTDLDGGMPTVSPTLEAAGVRGLARDLAARAVALNAAAAHVATEHGLTVALVEELSQRGIRCFTATTDREASEELRLDGSVRTTHEFRFVQWREYARSQR